MGFCRTAQKRAHANVACSVICYPSLSLSLPLLSPWLSHPHSLVLASGGGGHVYGYLCTHPSGDEENDDAGCTCAGILFHFGLALLRPSIAACRKETSAGFLARQEPRTYRSALLGCIRRRSWIKQRWVSQPRVMIGPAQTDGVGMLVVDLPEAVPLTHHTRTAAHKPAQLWFPRGPCAESMPVPGWWRDRHAGEGLETVAAGSCVGGRG